MRKLQKRGRILAIALMIALVFPTKTGQTLVKAATQEEANEVQQNEKDNNEQNSGAGENQVENEKEEKKASEQQMGDAQEEQIPATVVLDSENKNLETDTIYYYVDDKRVRYDGYRMKAISFNGKQLNLCDTMPGIIIDGVMMIPLYETMESDAIGGNVVVSGSGMIATRAGYSVYYEEGCQAIKDDNSLGAMDVNLVKIRQNQKDYFMVPAYELFSELGADKIELSDDGSTMVITKNTGNFLNMKFDLLCETKKNSVSDTKIWGDGTKEAMTVSYRKYVKPKFNVTKNYVKIDLKGTLITRELQEKIVDSKYAQEISVKNEGDNVQIVVKKKAGTPVVTQYGDGALRVLFNMKPIKVAVDCGHGANTPGKRTPKMPCNIDFDGDGKIDVKKGVSIREHQANVGVGKVLANELERMGFKVYRSAFGAKDISLSARQRNIKRFGAKYSISVHFNAVGSGRTFNKAQGFEVFSHSSKARDSAKLASIVDKEMAKGTKQINRGAKKMPLAMCNTYAMGTKASILVECAFMTNLHEAKTMMGNSKYWKETGKEIAKGVCSYSGISYFDE
ncbi:MAG: N-acetylmuramoyl-L-alanine amidase [Lachnospiraceae bacterium]|nr:N-acetylmuramoyl-L-alanine amidase [Lachnospiraceae bacterium]